MLLIFLFAGTFGFKELMGNTDWATAMAAQGLLVPAFVLLFGGAMGKSAQFPLNEWLLEALDRTNCSICINSRCYNG